MNRITSIKELYEWMKEKYVGDEAKLNASILQMYREDKIELCVVIEYLAITQADVMECMDESMESKY